MIWTKARNGLLAAGIAAALALAGCGGGGSNGAQDLPDPAVRFVNASSDSNGLDFFLNDQKIASAIGYMGSSTDFVRVPFVAEADGGYDYSINLAGTNEELERDYVVLERDTDSVFLAYGLEDPGDEVEKRVQQLRIPINRTAPNSQSRIYIVNALVRENGLDTGSVDLQSVDPNDPASEENPRWRKSDIVFGQFSQGNQEIEIDSGQHTLQARQSGSDSVLVYTQKTVTFGAGRIYLAIVSGKVDDTDPVRQPQITVIELTSR